MNAAICCTLIMCAAVGCCSDSYLSEDLCRRSIQLFCICRAVLLVFVHTAVLVLLFIEWLRIKRRYCVQRYGDTQVAVCKGKRKCIDCSISFKEKSQWLHGWPSVIHPFSHSISKAVLCQVLRRLMIGSLSKTENNRNCIYINSQSVPRSKQTASGLYKPVS